jgi:hypothetical protein
LKQIPLHKIAHGRSGDKGDTCNCGIIARRPEYYSLIAEQVTASKVKEHFGDFVKGEVIRYDLPKLQAFNFVMQNALGGGATESLRLDPLGKTYAAALLRISITVPDDFHD